VSELSKHSRQVLQHAVDDAYESRFGRLPEQIRSDLIARLGRLRFDLSPVEIDEWALEISEEQRIQVRIKI
jgi:hypothetical protein